MHTSELVAHGQSRQSALLVYKLFLLSHEARFIVITEIVAK